MNESFMKVFALVAESGEYDDYRKWIVAIYDNEADALAHKFYADQEAEKVRTKNDWQVRDSFKNAFDPSFDGRLGTIYSVEEYGVCDAFKKECFPEPTPEPEDIEPEPPQSVGVPIYPKPYGRSPWLDLAATSSDYNELLSVTNQGED
jgi:hypothetical protein